jgi:sensor histidine kinase YesM
MQKTNYKYFRLYSYLSLGVIMYLLFVLINPFDDFFKYYTKYKLIDYIVEIFYMLLFTAITVESGFLVTRIMNKHLPWEISPRIRFIFQLLIQVSILIIVFYGLFKLTGGITFNEPQPVNGLLLRQAIVLSILISLLNTAIFTAEYFFNKWGDAKMEGMQLKQHAIQAQLDALKAQIDPHFLFNNFSTLTALIEDNKELSIKFLQRLSQV